jgi:hypothetical protein
MLFSFWAWNIICAPDIFSWNFSFMLLNMGQLVYIIYQRRPVKFDPELEEAYHTLFHPFKVRLASRVTLPGFGVLHLRRPPPRVQEGMKMGYTD